MRYSYILLLCVILFLSVAHPAQAVGMRAVDEDEIEQNTFEYNEDIYVAGTCFPDRDKTVRVYVVESKAYWGNGVALTDVSGGAEIIDIDSAGNIPFTRVWKGPLEAGEYDIVIDTNGNGVHDSGESCIDAGSADGFVVLKKPTNTIRITAKKHFLSPDEHIWTQGIDDSEHVMYIFEISKWDEDDTEAVRITEIELEARGDGNDTQSVEEVLVVLDNDTSETYNSGDRILGRGMFSKNNGKVHIEVSQRLEHDEKLQLLIVYRMSEKAENAETFQVLIRDIEGYGVSTADVLNVPSLPLKSAEMVVHVPGEEEVTTETLDSSDDGNTSSGGFFSGGSDTNSDTEDNLSFRFEFDGLSLQTRAIVLGLVALLILWRVIAGLWRWFRP